MVKRGISDRRASVEKSSHEKVFSIGEIGSLSYTSELTASRAIFKDTLYLPRIGIRDSVYFSCVYLRMTGFYLEANASAIVTQLLYMN